MTEDTNTFCLNLVVLIAVPDMETFCVWCPLILSENEHEELKSVCNYKTWLIIANYEFNVSMR